MRVPPRTWRRPDPVAGAGQGTPAAGVRVIVTRPEPQAGQWVAQLQALGQPAAPLPLLGIADTPDTAAVADAWRRLAGFALVMFVSPSAVERFAAHRPAGLAWPAGVLAGSPGPGTEAALRAAGVPPEAIVSPPVEAGRFDSEALWEALEGLRPWTGASALIVRGEGGRDWLATTLSGHGAQVHFLEAYRRTAPVLDAAARGLLGQACSQPAAHAWLFSSSEAARHLPALAPACDWSRAWALATHERIAEAARDLGFGRVDRVDPSPAAVASHITRALQSARP
jgi:uroporphyrinogen-III synthase